MKNKVINKKVNGLIPAVLYLTLAPLTTLNAATPGESYHTLKTNLVQLFSPQHNESYRQVNIAELSNFQLDRSAIQELPVVGSASPASVSTQVSTELSLIEAVRLAVQRNPQITQSISSVAAQNANIDVARAGYYPQLSGGLSTGDMTTGERGRQLLSLNAIQMLYDFGKVRSGVNTEQARLQAEQANVLVSIDEIALEVANAVINIKRYQELSRIAQQQISGIQYILEIANLRAKAGISSQADPVQAQSYLESAQANLISQQSFLRQYQQRLRTLLGFEVSHTGWIIPETLVARSALYEEPQFTTIPQMMVAQAQVEIAKSQREQTRLSRYPTLNVRGSLSQAVNGQNPNNNEDDGLYSSVMLEATSNFYQGGAVTSQTRAAGYAEQAARARVNAVYLDVLDQVRTTREQVENKQRQMQVLVARQATTVRTKELYQEQYKLGTRTVVDLLNAEQSIHSSASEIEIARYDIYDSIVQNIAATGRSRDVYDLNNVSIQGFEIQP
ncbi:TolC family protein [Acinetobacter sp. UBA1297]|uniref:TolC family protein n=1 Tax=Acinetobacter sp. UBA1297 TaxID=1945925 RepID=UPI00257B1E83|nr:TolC family protein [Acinetobacter sp. UBA1297]